MPPERSIFAAVLLAGADESAVAALQPAAEVLASFGIEITTLVFTTGGPAAGTLDGVAAVIVAAPDGALPAALATQTEVPVIRVPTEAGGRKGLALLHDGDGRLPAGPVDGVFATMAIGEAGAKNAALFVVSVLAVGDERLRLAWRDFRSRQTEAVLRQGPLGLEN